jgi:cytoskeletal protein RodZ
MHSVGTTIRQARDQQHRTIGQIAEATRIPYHYLEAIESDDVSAFPGNFFYKSFVRQYCSALEVPYQSVGDRVEKMLQPEIVDPLKAIAVARTGSHQTLEPEHSWRRRAFWPGLLLLMILTGGFGMYAWQQKTRRQPAMPAASFVSPKPLEIGPVRPLQKAQNAPMVVAEDKAKDVGTRSRRRSPRRSRRRSARRVHQEKSPFVK